MSTEFDDELQARLLAFQQRHGLTEDGVAGGQTWQKLAEVSYGAQATDTAVTGAAQATDPALMGAPVEARRPLVPIEPMTREQLQAAWRQAPTRDDFRLRVFGVRAVPDAELDAFLLQNGCIKAADDQDYTYDGPSIGPTAKGQEVVGRWIMSPDPDGGFTKKWVTGTKKQLDKLQHDENNRATVIGVTGVAGALAGTAQGRGRGAGTPGAPVPGRASGKSTGAEVRPAPAAAQEPATKPASATGPRARTGAARPAAAAATSPAGPRTPAATGPAATDRPPPSSAGGRPSTPPPAGGPPPPTKERKGGETRKFEPPMRDHIGQETGELKVGGVIPETNDDRKHAVDSWTREELTFAAAELEESIAARNREQLALGETSIGDQGQRRGATHRERIRNEEALLRAVRKKLGGS